MSFFRPSRPLPVRRPSSPVSTLAMVVVALGLTATVAQAQTPPAAPQGVFQPGMLNPAAIAANFYAGLEYCGVDENRLQSFKRDMRAKAQELQRIPPEKFDEMFAAALPEARQQVKANAAEHPQEAEQFCEKERGGL